MKLSVRRRRLVSIIPVLLVATIVPQAARAAGAATPAASDAVGALTGHETQGGPICAVSDPAAVALNAAGVFPYTLDADAGAWRTWLVGLGDVVVPPPPAIGSPQHVLELAEVQRATLTRTEATAENARYWGMGAASSPWTDRLLQLVARHSTRPTKNPPRLSRQMAMFEVAVFDALVLAWNAKYCYLRPPPSALDPLIRPIGPVPAAPSYPSEHAVVAGVAAVMLPNFFPDPEEPAGTFESLAWEAAGSRVDAGTNYASDVTAGMQLGRAVARAVLTARLNDGSSAQWDGTGRITGTCNWSPTPPGFVFPPAEPVWGRVRPWLMTSGSQFRPAPPPACDGLEYLAAARDVYETSLTLTDRQRAIAQYWAGGPGTETPPGMNLRTGMEVADRHELSTMHHARVLAHTAAAMADAAVAAWDAKFTYWWDRPVQTIRRLWDPTWVSFIGTPPFPGYVSGHSTFSAAATETLAHFFPEDAIALRSMATEAAMSRFYGGIHARYDNEVGLTMGSMIGQLAAGRAMTDGAES